jgi:hypothetical protein
MNDSEINDIRKEKELKSITFSKYKKTEVKKALLKSMYDEQIEDSCYWSCELICSGAFIELWELILLFMSKHIHIGNPKLPIYLSMRFDNFKTLLQNGYVGDELSMRNNDRIRKLFAEIITVLCTSKKKHPFDSIKIKHNEFDMTHMKNKLKAPNVEYVSKVFRKDDPKELFIALNELSYHISKDSKNSLEACYWIEWIIEFENICKKQKQLCTCDRRSFVKVNDKFIHEPIWVVWDIIFFHCKQQRNNELSLKIINSLFNLFCLKYTSNCKRKRKFIIYFSISLLIDNYDNKREIIGNKDIVNRVIQKINNIYKEIKKNEITPNTDYLFNGVEKTNREKTIEKLEKLNNMEIFTKIK